MEQGRYMCIYVCICAWSKMPLRRMVTISRSEVKNTADTSTSVKEVSKQVEHVECVNSGAQRYHTLRLVHYIVPRNGQLHGSAVRDRPLLYVLR